MEKTSILGLAVILALGGLSISCSREHSGSAKSAADVEREMAGKNPHEMARVVFENYNCKQCHTLSDEGKFGFTSWGSQLRQSSEGCIALLTTMNTLVHVPESQWTHDEKVKHEHFEQYGCSTCHKVTPGRMGLTEVGEKLASFHLSCPEVQKVLTSRASIN